MLEAEQLARNSGCRILMDGKTVPVFTLEAEASCKPLERPVALASKEELQRVLLRIWSVSEVARAIATETLAPSVRHQMQRRSIDVLAASYVSRRIRISPRTAYTIQVSGH